MAPNVLGFLTHAQMLMQVIVHRQRFDFPVQEGIFLPESAFSALLQELYRSGATHALCIPICVCHIFMCANNAMAASVWNFLMWAQT